jgi:uncharacterized protein with WD repeat
MKRWILFIICNSLCSQTKFERIYPALHVNAGISPGTQMLTATPDQQFLMVNYVSKPSNPDYYDGGVSKLDSTGHLLWTRIFANNARYSSWSDSLSFLSVTTTEFITINQNNKNGNLFGAMD